MPKTNQKLHRCDWAGTDSLYIQYHDSEWGVALHDDIKLFEFLILEGMQAGLSWLTILKKRENFRRAFDQFDPEAIAGYGRSEIERLLADSGIIRNRLKIEATIANAQAYLDTTEQFDGFDHYIWQFVDGRTLKNKWRKPSEIPAQTDISRSMSRDLKKRGFKFVGPTICYAFMQATGMVNDHLCDCFRYHQV